MSDETTKAPTTPAEKRRRTIEDRQFARFDRTRHARKEFFRAVRVAVKAAMGKGLRAPELKLYAIAAVAAEAERARMGARNVKKS
jgi:hypothetical protein